jgi:hypothetical protein
MTKEKGISGSTLKIIAIFIMIIDHIGLGIWYRLPGLGYLVPDVIDQATWWSVYIVMRRIGRTAFPIFCFLLVEGFFNTKNHAKYAMRLFSFALISQLPFQYAFQGLMNDGLNLNVFFTLFIGLILIWGMTKIKERWPNYYLFMPGWLLSCAIAGFLAYRLDTDYDYRGILLIVILYLFRKTRLISLIAGYLSFLWEAYCLPGFILAWFYNGKRGLKTKLLFYMVYPAHLFLIYLAWKYLL